MKQRVKTVEQSVGYLRGGQVRYVSLVDHGANQEPFRILKQVKKGDGVMPRKLKFNTKKVDTASPKASAISRLTFAKSAYADEASVISYLDENGWEGYTVEDSGEMFTAKGAEVSVENERPVEVETGIISYVGEVVETPADAADTVDGGDTEEKAAKGKCPDCGNATAQCSCKKSDAKDAEDKSDKNPETEAKSEAIVAVKYESWDAYVSSEGKLADVIEDGMSDGTPPGFEDIMLAVRTAAGNILKQCTTPAECEAQLLKLGADFGGLLALVASTYNTFITTEDTGEMAQKYVASVKKFAGIVDSAKSAGTEDALAAILSKLSSIEDSVANAAKDAKTALEEVAAMKTAKPATVSRKSLLIDEPVASSNQQLSRKEMEEFEKDAEFLKNCR